MASNEASPMLQEADFGEPRGEAGAPKSDLFADCEYRLPRNPLARGRRATKEPQPARADTSSRAPGEEARPERDPDPLEVLCVPCEDSEPEGRRPSGLRTWWRDLLGKE
jgi:hypothetical protein